MSSDVNVKFTADSSGLDKSSDDTAARVASNFAKMEAATKAANEAAVRYKQTLEDIRDNTARTAHAAEEQLWWMKLRGALELVVVGYDMTTTAAQKTLATSYQISNGFFGVVQSVDAATESLARYVKKSAEASAQNQTYEPLVHLQNSGTMASLGRGMQSADELANSVRLSMSSTPGDTVKNTTGADLAAMTKAMSDLGIADKTNGVAILMGELEKIPGLSDDAAAAMVKGFTTAKNTTGDFERELMDVTVRLSKTPEDAQKLAQSLTAALNSDQSRSAIADSMAAAMKNRMEEVTKSLNEQQAAYEKMGSFQKLFHKDQSDKIKTEEDAKSVLDEQINKLHSLAQAADEYKNSLVDVSDQAQAILDKLEKAGSLPSLKLDDLSKKLDILYRTYGNVDKTYDNTSPVDEDGEGGTRNKTGEAADLIRRFEGFKPDAYRNPYDATPGLTIGYGMKEIYDPDTMKPTAVESGQKMSSEQAEEQLALQIPIYQERIEKQLDGGDAAGNRTNGADVFAKMSDELKATLTSVAWNYGSLPESIVKAINSYPGQANEDKIATAIRALPDNKERRYQEASNIGGDLPDFEKMTPAAEEGIRKLTDEVNKTLAQINGGDYTQKNEQSQAYRNASGQGDSLLDAKENLATKLQIYQTTTETLAKSQALTEVYKAQTELADKEAAVKKAMLGSTDPHNAEAVLQKAKETYEIEMGLAGQDAVKKAAAEDTYTQAKRSYADEQRTIATEAANSEYNIALANLERKKSLIKDEQTAHLLTGTTKLAADMAYEDERLALEIAHYTKLRDLNAGIPLEYQRMSDKILEITAKEGEKRASIAAADNSVIEKQYEALFSKMDSTVTSGIMGMIKGTETFKKMMTDVALDVVQAYVKAGVDMVTHWAESLTQMLVQSIVNQTQQTAVASAGASQRLAVQSTSAAASLAVDKSTSALTISGDASKAAAGAYAAVAGFPLIGPVLAPGAAAAAYGAVMAFGVHDTGAWNLPSDQLSVLHAGETVLPARGGVAEEFRKFYGEGGGGGQQGSVSPVFNVTAMDSRSIGQFFHDNRHHIASALNGAVKDGRTAQLSRLAQR